MTKLDRLLAASAGFFILGGCAVQTSQEPATAAPVLAEFEEGEVGQLALALSRADAADGAGDQAALKEAVRRIDGLGGQPMEPEADDPLPGWRAQVEGNLPPMRGRALGPAYRRGSLGPNRTVRTEQLFLAGQKARIALESPAGQGLTLNVLDDQNNPVCEGARSSLRCQWIPIFTQRYRIEVTNRDDTTKRYYLVID